MKKFKFKIIGKAEDKPQTIYLSLRFGRNDKLMYATPLRVEPMYWNEELGRVRNTRHCANRDHVNNALMAIENKMNEIISSSTIKGVQLTKDSVKRELDMHFGKSYTARTDMDFHTYFEQFIEQCKTRTNGKRGGQLITYRTRCRYARTYELLREYERQQRVFLDFPDINQTFAENFVAYLQSLNQATNTIGNKVDCIKTIMRNAYEQGYSDNTRYQFIKSQAEESDNVALSEEELKTITDFDLSKHPRLARTRDVFLVGCWTGLRFGDVGRLRKEHIGDDGIITITQSKTDDPVCIPLHPLVKEIMERYDYRLPIISNQKFNEYIKEVCKLAGIDKPFIKSITRGGVKQSTVYPKWQLVSSHTARRSFATNLYLAGFPSLSIMSITGHRTETAFLKYIKVSKAEHAKKLLEYWDKVK